jgi:hypothetical protein
LTQITVLFISDSTLIQYKLRRYRVQSLSGLALHTLFPFQNASFRRTCFFMKNFDKQGMKTIPSYGMIVHEKN